MRIRRPGSRVLISAWESSPISLRSGPDPPGTSSESSTVGDGSHHLEFGEPRLCEQGLRNSEDLDRFPTRTELRSLVPGLQYGGHEAL